MPVVKKIEPTNPDILTQRIFACDPDEEREVIIGAIREHIDIWGTKSLFRTNPHPTTKTLRLDNAQVVIFLIQGAFELGAELVDVDKHVVKKEGFAYAIEGEELIRLRKQTAVVVLWVDWEGEKELEGLGPDVEVLMRADRGELKI